MGRAAIQEFLERQRKEQSQQESGFRAAAQAAPRPRTIVRFESSVDRLLISGGLAGGEALAGSAAVVDAPMGEGHVLMFAINPMWRGQTHGSYTFLLNALLHHDYLDPEGR